MKQTNGYGRRLELKAACNDQDYIQFPNEESSCIQRDCHSTAWETNLFCSGVPAFIINHPLPGILQTAPKIAITVDQGLCNDSTLEEDSKESQLIDLITLENDPLNRKRVQCFPALNLCSEKSILKPEGVQGKNPAHSFYDLRGFSLCLFLSFGIKLLSKSMEDSRHFPETKIQALKSDPLFKNKSQQENDLQLYKRGTEGVQSSK